MAANDERVRRLLGRVSALKARDFEVIPASGKAEMLTERGIEEPLARITVEFASRDPLVLRVGNDAPETSKHQQHAYMWLEDDTTVYVARKGLLDEFGKDPKELRNRRVVRMTAEEVVSIDVVLRATEDDELAGEHGVRFAVEQWVWKDGVPVPGSTPKRVAENLAELEVEAFVDDEPGQLKAYGLDNPIARVVLADREGLERVVLIGGYGEPDIGPDDREIKRRYVSIEGAQSVYLAGERTVDVVRDLIREGNRKQRKDRERAARRERIPTVQAPEEESL